MVNELWHGFAMRRKRSQSASFTPYYTPTLIGPFARLQFGFRLGAPPEDQYQTLVSSTTLLVGVRTQLRLKKAAPPPEVPP